MRRREGNLPADVTSFIGRSQELAELRARLSDSRLVTLTGVGGVGKTRLAIRIAAEVRRAFPDGTWYVELAAVEDPALLAEAVATSLGVVKQSTRPPMAQLHHHLAGKRMLVVLDNCEQISDACAGLVDELLRATALVRFLVTSRHALGVLGERIFTVPPLSTPGPATGSGAGPDPDLDPASMGRFDSVALLRARASDSVPGFELTDANCAEVARLCERLDGIPLAIELAAARLRTLSVGDVLDRLDRRFQLLTEGNSAALPRQQTLRALIDWSHALCSAKEQALWARLSVFAGSFGLASVEAVCAGDGLAAEEILDVVDGLVRKSVLITERTGERVRYRLLETVREYGADRLGETGGSMRLRLAHRDHFRLVAEQSFREWCGPDQAAWLTRLREDHANLRAAFDRGVEFGGAEFGGAEMPCALAAALQWYWIAGGSLGEGRRWLGQAVEAGAGAGVGAGVGAGAGAGVGVGVGVGEPSIARATALWVDAYLAVLRGELADAGARLGEAERLGRILRTPVLDAYTAQLRGMAALFGGDLDAARAHYERGLAGHEERGDTAGVVSMLFQLAVVLLFAGEPARSTALCERSLRLSADRGERWAAAYAMWALALNRWTLGDCAGADELARESLRVKLEFRDDLGIAHMVELLSWIAASDGRHTESARLLGAAATVWDNLGTSMSVFGTHLADCRSATRVRLREALGVDEADALVDEGAALSIDQVTGDVLGMAEIPSRTDPEEQAAGPMLSVRELEVARLVAHGMTNREIAARLVLSSRTVDTHVQHIMSKLGFHSRSQIAGWVVQYQ